MMRTQEIGTLALELAMGADRTSEFESMALPHAASLLRYAMHLDDSWQSGGRRSGSGNAAGCLAQLQPV